MKLKQLLEQIDRLKVELDKLRPISVENMGRFSQKIRLEWNYHSNNLEGNRLSYGETKALILFGTTAQAKPLKDHLEVEGHDEAIKYIDEVIKQERPLTENFIRELHEMILKKPYEVDAITPEGKPIKRTVSIGKYKSVPNHVKTKMGEIFRFATPEETSAEMTALMNWYRNEMEKPTKHTALMAIEFHYRFIRIHPFDDGNGRIARLLMNFIFMQNGLVPAIIRTEDKENYFEALQEADAGNLDYFFEYVARQLIASLELLLKAAKGESLEEPGDLDKKLALLQKEIEGVDEDNEIKTKLSVKAVKDSFESWGYQLLEKLAETTIKFNKFYDSPKHNVTGHMQNVGESFPWFDFTDTFSLDILKVYWEKVELETELHNADLRFNCHYGGYIKGGLNTFGCNYGVEVKFETYKYKVLIDYYDTIREKRETMVFTERLLHKPLTEDEIEEINMKWGNTLFEHIKRKTEELKNGK